MAVATVSGVLLVLISAAAEIVYASDIRTKRGEASVEELLKRAVEGADNIMAAAIRRQKNQNLSADRKPILDAIVNAKSALRQAYRNGKVVLPKNGIEALRCQQNPGWYLFTNRDDRIIYVCSIAINDDEVQVEDLSEMLIHEGHHLNQDATLDLHTSECDATIVEIAAMKWAGFGARYDNGNWADCGITPEMASAQR